ncbi:DNA-processing protein DprA [Anaerofustis sp.]|uniref:DNA-processing protein DprA n=1 Tax=Anaerofustis sp. TaxID=1872517 RepID=UPI0025BBBE85|nr:DNA-processing protein DprA [Anaerofustis sp.]
MNISKWLWLMSIQNVGAKKAISLYDYFGSVDDIYENDDISRYTKVKGITLDIATRLITDKDLTKYDRIIDKMYEENINYITMDDKYYPYSLKEIYDYPPILFYKGKNLFIEENPMISIVGTRRASNYGMKVAQHFAMEFSNRGIDVVSGMAMGIDTYAHLGALKGFGDTIAVLGCGVDKIYPKSNERLYNEIIEGRGMVVSEYIPGTEPLSHHFPARNRIISGLSHGTVVIEASYKSGSLITAKYANEQGREVYAVPGNITSSICEGSNSLLKDGAKLILSADDVIEDLYYLLKKPVDKYLKNDNIERLNMDDVNIVNKRELLNLDDNEKVIYDSILEGNNTVDLISQNVDMEINLINSILTMLEIRGIVISTGAKIELK